MAAVVVAGSVMEGNILERQSLLKALVIGSVQMGWETESVHTVARVHGCRIGGMLIMNELAYCSFLTLLPDRLVLSACKCLQPSAIVNGRCISLPRLSMVFRMCVIIDNFKSRLLLPNKFAAACLYLSCSSNRLMN